MQVELASALIIPPSVRSAIAPEHPHTRLGPRSHTLTQTRGRRQVCNFVGRSRRRSASSRSSWCRPRLPLCCQTGWGLRLVQPPGQHLLDSFIQVTPELPGIFEAPSLLSPGTRGAANGLVTCSPESYGRVLGNLYPSRGEEEGRGQRGGRVGGGGKRRRRKRRRRGAQRIQVSRREGDTQNHVCGAAGPVRDPGFGVCHLGPGAGDGLHEPSGRSPRQGLAAERPSVPAEHR